MPIMKRELPAFRKDVLKHLAIIEEEWGISKSELREYITQVLNESYPVETRD